MNVQALGIEPPKVGVRDRNSPMCTLSQNGYGACLLIPESSINIGGTPHEWSWACLWARPTNMNFEFVQHVCYDSENALLEYGHNPRPQLLCVKQKDGS